jgi:hypothetical protein
MRDKQMSIFLSPVAETNLANYLENFGADSSKPKSYLSNFFGCLISAVRHIHESYFTHGDIKPANILVSHANPPNVLLCDFGASRSHSDEAGVRIRKRPLTLRYCAPEAMNANRRGRRADIFSLGCVFSEMATTLWLSKEELTQYKAEFRSIIFHKELPRLHLWLEQAKKRANELENVAISAIQAMLDPQPSNRSTAIELSGVFPARACCVAWPSAEAVRVSTFEALQALSNIKYTLEVNRVSLLSVQETLSSPLLCGFLGSATPDEQIIAENLLDLSLRMARNRKGESTRASLIGHWLQTCISKHENCSHNNNDLGEWRPSRLIDVGPWDSGIGGARLILTAHLSVGKVEYVTLSHDWGNSHREHLILTTETLPLMLDLISIDKLPQVVADAIVTTRSLGLRYLWADSLCIMQDSTEDLAREFQVMNNIFRNALFTLLISSSHEASYQWSLNPQTTLTQRTKSAQLLFRGPVHASNFVSKDSYSHAWASPEVSCRGMKFQNQLQPSVVLRIFS